jgi:hypothetical protein
VYGYRINATMARALIWLYQTAPDGEWVNIQTQSPAWILRTKSMSTLKYWGLIEPKGKDDTSDTRCSGVWRITSTGVKFALNKITINKKAFVFDDKVQGFSDDYADIMSCLGTKFSYKELMNTRAIGG